MELPKRKAYLKISKGRVKIYLSYELDDAEEEFLFNHLLDNWWDIKTIEEEEFNVWHRQKGNDPSVNSYLLTSNSLDTTLQTL